jgi:hypothetical protein
MLIDLKDDEEVEFKLCEVAKEERDNNNYGENDRNKNIRL